MEATLGNMDNIDLLEQISSLKASIAKKNELLDSLRSKLKRYEFCVQEAILFLGKPVITYNEWLKGTQKDKTPQNLAEKQIGLLNAVETINSMNLTNVGVNFEIKAMECIKLALNYLVSARNSINKSQDNSDSLKLNKDSENRAEILDAIDKIKTQTKSEPLNITTNHQKSNSVRSYHQSFIVKNLDDDDGDIAVLHPKQEKVERKSCTQCTQRMLAIDKLNETITDKQNIINDLSNQIKLEQEAKERIIVSKEILEQELEDLTEQLFEQANNMVIEEAKNREDLENRNISLTVELSSAIKRAQGREEEIQDLKKIINALKTAKIKSSSVASLGSSPSMAMIPAVFVDVPKGIFSFEKLPSVPMIDNIFIDGIIYCEVQDHISATLMSAEINASTQFMKRVISEDIEPCVFYCYSFPGSLKSIGSGGASSSFKKRFIESLCKCLCQAVNDQTSDESHSDKSTLKLKCALCTVVREVSFKFTFGVKSEEIQVCRFCRDRILPCMDFFSYNNYLRQNKPNSSILSIFRCFMWLRKRIYAGRVGSCSIFDTDYPSLVTAYALPADWEANSHIVN